jgi:1-acyl-sn-glycerol-3-phosphate acyltransferase
MIVIKFLLSCLAGLFIILCSLIFDFIGWWLMFIPVHLRFKFADNFMIQPWTFFVNNLVLFIRVKIIGKEYVDKKRPTLYICNHQSWADIQILVKYSHAPGLARKEVLTIPFVGLLTMYSGSLFFDKEELNSRLKVIKKLITFFKKGASLCVYPEGTRSPDGSLIEPNLTSLKLCYKLGIPVVPAAIEGTRDIMARNRPYFKFFQKVILKYNPPMFPKDFKSDDEFAEACWNTVRSSHAEIFKMHNN